jgi:tol-pal system protein YbgF
LVSILLSVGAGCATTQSAAPSARAAQDMERSMIELRAQNAGYVRHIEELQNRVFILEDRIDSRGVADGERDSPAAPKSTRIGEPTREAALVSEEPPGEEADATIEYAGEAALPPSRGRTRPSLHISTNGRITPAAAPSPPLAAEASAVPAAAEPLRLYRQALDALHVGRHAAALTGLRKFLARYPRHDYADNAQYWIGECYYDLRQYKAAVREFRRVVDRYPHGNKVPDAMLKIGFADLATGDRRDGRQVLEALCKSYPRHAATRLAVARLAQPDDRAPPTVTLEMGRR